MPHRTELTLLGYLLWGNFFSLDFGPTRPSKCSLQFIVIDKIHVQITNTRDYWLHVYFHLVPNVDNVRVFDVPSCLALFFCLMKLFRPSKAIIEKIVPWVS